jgi:hypothetical protein
MGRYLRPLPLLPKPNGFRDRNIALLPMQGRAPRIGLNT